MPNKLDMDRIFRIFLDIFIILFCSFISYQILRILLGGSWEFEAASLGILIGIVGLILKLKRRYKLDKKAIYQTRIKIGK